MRQCRTAWLRQGELFLRICVAIRLVGASYVNWVPGSAAVKQIEGRGDSWIDSVTFELRNGTHNFYNNSFHLILPSFAALKGKVRGPFTLEDGEVILTVRQKVRRQFWSKFYGIGDELEFETSKNGGPGRNISLIGTHEGFRDAKITKTARAGYQIIGVRFEKNTLVDIEEVPYVDGCSNTTIWWPPYLRNKYEPLLQSELPFPYSIMFNSSCPWRLPVGKSCTVSCTAGLTEIVEQSEFRCFRSEESPYGQVPNCYPHVRWALASAVLTAVAALAAAVTGAYGRSRQRQEVATSTSVEAPGAYKLSMVGAWKDALDGDVFYIWPSDGDKNELWSQNFPRQVLSMLFDLPLSREERRLAMCVVRSTCLGWKFEHGSIACALQSIGSAEEAGAAWWRGRILWSAANGVSIERVSQHSIILAIPGKQSRPLIRQHDSTRFWNVAFPAVMLFLGIVSYKVRAASFSSALYFMTVVMHFVATYYKNWECYVPDVVPRFGTLAMVVTIVMLNLHVGHTFYTQLKEILGGILLAFLFKISSAGHACYNTRIGNRNLAGAVLVAIALLIWVVFHLLYSALTAPYATHAMDLGVAACVAIGLLQLVAAKVWSNHADVRFTTDAAAIELAGDTHDVPPSSHVNATSPVADTAVGQVGNAPTSTDVRPIQSEADRRFSFPAAVGTGPVAVAGAAGGTAQDALQYVQGGEKNTVEVYAMDEADGS